MRRPRGWVIGGALWLAAGAAASAQGGEGEGLRLDPRPQARWVTSLERWHLPGGEAMGMVGGRLLLDVGSGWRLGPATYGAVEGQRGGFITLGLEVEREWRLSPDWAVQAGAFVGGGGGRGGRELAGGGAMLRAHVGATWYLTPYDRLGLGVSHVRFPSEGAIRSTQPYLRYERQFGVGLTADERQPPAEWGGITWSEQAWAARWRTVAVPDGLPRVGGAGMQRDFQTLGVEWRAYPGSGNGFVTLGADGALGGGSAGYMQVLAGAGWRWPLWSGAEGRVHAAAGPAGGGGVDTGGGLLTEVGGTLAQRLSRHSAIELGWFAQKGVSAPYRGQGVTLQWSYRLEGHPEGATVQDWRAFPLRMRVLHQQYDGRSAQWRCCDADLAVRNVGVAIDWRWGDPADPWQPYWTGQGLAAYAGRAGAYMTGLLGGGVQWQLHPRWALEVEALTGAAGGGGLQTGNGWVAQWGAAVVYRPGGPWTWSVGAGRMHAMNGPLRVKTMTVALGYEFSGWWPGN